MIAKIILTENAFYITNHRQRHRPAGSADGALALKVHFCWACLFLAAARYCCYPVVYLADARTRRHQPQP
jgi:hypothetical protein